MAFGADVVGRYCAILRTDKRWYLACVSEFDATTGQHTLTLPLQPGIDKVLEGEYNLSKRHVRFVNFDGSLAALNAPPSHDGRSGAAKLTFPEDIHSWATADLPATSAQGPVPPPSAPVPPHRDLSKLRAGLYSLKITGSWPQDSGDRAPSVSDAAAHVQQALAAARVDVHKRGVVYVHEASGVQFLVWPGLKQLVQLSLAARGHAKVKGVNQATLRAPVDAGTTTSGAGTTVGQARGSQAWKDLHAAATAAGDDSSGLNLLFRGIRVWSGDDADWRSGRVLAYDSQSKSHFAAFDDGVRRWVSLREGEFVLCAEHGADVVGKRVAVERSAVSWRRVPVAVQPVANAATTPQQQGATEKDAAAASTAATQPTPAPAPAAAVPAQGTPVPATQTHGTGPATEAATPATVPSTAAEAGPTQPLTSSDIQLTAAAAVPTSQQTGSTPVTTTPAFAVQPRETPTPVQAAAGAAVVSATAASAVPQPQPAVQALAWTPVSAVVWSVGTVVGYDPDLELHVIRFDRDGEQVGVQPGTGQASAGPQATAGLLNTDVHAVYLHGHEHLWLVDPSALPQGFCILGKRIQMLCNVGRASNESSASTTGATAETTVLSGGKRAEPTAAPAVALGAGTITSYTPPEEVVIAAEAAAAGAGLVGALQHQPAANGTVTGGPALPVPALTSPHATTQLMLGLAGSFATDIPQLLRMPHATLPNGTKGDADKDGAVNGKARQDGQPHPRGYRPPAASLEAAAPTLAAALQISAASTVDPRGTVTVMLDDGGVYKAVLAGLSFTFLDEAVPGVPPAPGQVGLVNLGNTCYLNSVLQGLVHVKPLASYVSRPAFLASLNTSNRDGMGGRMAVAFALLVRAMWAGGHTSGQDSSCSATSPAFLKALLAERNSTFTGTGQQDAHEALMALLDAMHEDLAVRDDAASAAAIADAEAAALEDEKEKQQKQAKEDKERLEREKAEAKAKAKEEKGKLSFGFIGRKSSAAAAKPVDAQSSGASASASAPASIPTVPSTAVLYDHQKGSASSLVSMLGVADTAAGGRPGAEPHASGGAPAVLPTAAVAGQADTRSESRSLSPLQGANRGASSAVEDTATGLTLPGVGYVPHGSVSAPPSALTSARSSATDLTALALAPPLVGSPVGEWTGALQGGVAAATTVSGGGPGGVAPSHGVATLGSGLPSGLDSNSTLSPVPQSLHGQDTGASGGGPGLSVTIPGPSMAVVDPRHTGLAGAGPRLRSGAGSAAPGQDAVSSPVLSDIAVTPQGGGTAVSGTAASQASVIASSTGGGTLASAQGQDSCTTPVGSATGASAAGGAKQPQASSKRPVETTSIIKQLFFMQTQADFTCTKNKGHTVTRHGPRGGELLPPLPIAGKVAQKQRVGLFFSKTTMRDPMLQDCLDNYFRPAEGENSVVERRCEKCNKTVPMIQQPWLRSLPPVIVIQLKRFEFSPTSGENTKLLDPIAFPVRDLDLARYLHPSVLNGHNGGTASGAQGQGPMLASQKAWDAAVAAAEASLGADVGSEATVAAGASGTGAAGGGAAGESSGPSVSAIAHAPLPLDGSASTTGAAGAAGNGADSGKPMPAGPGSSGPSSAAAAPCHALLSAPTNGKYDLFAVVCHVGNVERGHYTTYARASDDQRTSGPGCWWYFDDTSVIPARESDVLHEKVSRLAYLLFYVRQTPGSVAAYRLAQAQAQAAAAAAAATANANANANGPASASPVAVGQGTAEGGQNGAGAASQLSAPAPASGPVAGMAALSQPAATTAAASGPRLDMRQALGLGGSAAATMNDANMALAMAGGTVA